MINLKRVFKAKHWHIFFAFLIFPFLQATLQGINARLDLFFHILFVVLYVGWLLLLGCGLKKISKNPGMSYRTFLAIGFGLFIVIISFRVLVLTDNIFLKRFDETFLAISMMCFIWTALVVMASFIGKSLRMIETDDDVSVNDYFEDTLALIFWPIGIWTFQPRINKIANRLN